MQIESVVGLVLVLESAMAASPAIISGASSTTPEQCEVLMDGEVVSALPTVPDVHGVRCEFPLPDRIRHGRHSVQMRYVQTGVPGEWSFPPLTFTTFMNGPVLSIHYDRGMTCFGRGEERTCHEDP